MDEIVFLRESLRRFLNFESVDASVPYTVRETLAEPEYTFERITYAAADGDEIPAFLLVPDRDGPLPAALVHHQHAGQRHLGKSEVVGLVGDPLQAFGPALAKRGFVVLAPDSICFEDRRANTSGIQPHPADEHQHYIEMGQRLTQGDTLMRKLLSDASSGLSFLAHHRKVDAAKLGVVGHSYGGTTALFQAALETNIAFAVSSGALCSYEYKRKNNLALEMALIIPGFVARWDFQHLLNCIAPRPILIVSAEDDPHSKDADRVIDRAKPNNHIRHFRDQGGHAMTQDRFNHIVTYVADRVS